MYGVRMITKSMPNAALRRLDVDVHHALALFVGHRPELADVAEAVVARQVELRDAMLEVRGVSRLVDAIVAGEDRRQRGPDAVQHLLRVFLGFVLAIFHAGLRFVVGSGWRRA
jgi:hypothetical protein